MFSWRMGLVVVPSHVVDVSYAWQGHNFDRVEDERRIKREYPSGTDKKGSFNPSVVLLVYIHAYLSLFMQAYLESQHHHCMTQHTHAHMQGRTQAGICITDDGQKEGSRANTGIQTHHPFLFFPSYSTLPCRRFVRYDINSKPNPSILLCSPPPQKSTLQRRVPRTLLTTRRFTLTSPYHFTSSTF